MRLQIRAHVLLDLVQHGGNAAPRSQPIENFTPACFAIRADPTRGSHYQAKPGRPATDPDGGTRDRSGSAMGHKLETADTT